MASAVRPSLVRCSTDEPTALSTVSPPMIAAFVARLNTTNATVRKTAAAIATNDTPTVSNIACGESCRRGRDTAVGCSSAPDGADGMGGAGAGAGTGAGGMNAAVSGSGGRGVDACGAGAGAGGGTGAGAGAGVAVSDTVGAVNAARARSCLAIDSMRSCRNCDSRWSSILAASTPS